VTTSSNRPGRALVALVALATLVLGASACSDADLTSASQSSTAAPASAAPTTTATTSSTTLLSSDPVAGVPGEPPAAPAELHGDVRVPSFPELVRYAGTQDVRSEQVVTLTAGRVAQGVPFFAPTILEGSPNQRITLRISNTTPSSHNFTLEAEHINAALSAGATVDITVQFPTSGALVFYCRLHSDEQHGGGLYTVT
jgi:plastocyanin